MPVKKKVVVSSTKAADDEKATTKKATSKKATSKKATAKKATTKKASTEKTKSGREIVYPTVGAKKFDAENPLTEEVAKRLLGWRELPGDDKGDYLIKDLNGCKIVGDNDIDNRQIYPVIYHTIKQEILRGRYKLNGETIILGKTAKVLDGQHTLIGVVLANQAYQNDPEAYPFWNDDPYIERFVIVGIEEDDDTVNTINTGKPRSFADVLYRSEYFSQVAKKNKKILASIADNAVRFLWKRTGLMKDADSPKRTHSESIDFINRHPRLLACVKHIGEENENGVIAKYTTPGKAAGLLYFMGCSATDRKGYYAEEEPNEELLDWSMWDKAEEFWTLLGQNSEDLKAVRKSIVAVVEDEGTNSDPSRLAIIVKAWHAFLSSGEVTAKDLKLKYDVDDEGWKTLMECPSVGGIDQGNPDGEEDLSDDEEENNSREDIEVQKELIRKERADAMKEKNRDEDEDRDEEVEGIDPNSFKPNELLKVTPYADCPIEEPWKGRFVDLYAQESGYQAKVRVQRGYPNAGRVFDVPLEHLSR